MTNFLGLFVSVELKVFSKGIGLLHNLLFFVIRSNIILSFELLLKSFKLNSPCFGSHKIVIMSFWELGKEIKECLFL